MSNLTWKAQRPKVATRQFVMLFSMLVLLSAGCRAPDDGSGFLITEIPLATDTLLNLNCADVGIYLESCVLTDPENPYATAVINEFDQNNPDAETKFDLVNALPSGQDGAKARFYLWATALARRPNGENQWYTARALHELYNANSDPLIQAQALRAYRSVLDNFFGSVTFFECCAGLDPNDPAPIAFSASLNELVADNLYRTASTTWVRLIPGDPLLAQAELAQWGYTYQPATPPNFDNGVLSVNEG